jgi:hypothetical protein
MTTPEDLVDGVGKLLPGAALTIEHIAAIGREPIKTATALSRFFHPPARNKSAILEPAKHRVQRADAKSDAAA